MEEKAHPQYARIENPFGASPPILHCPICGQPSTSSMEDGLEPTPCPHLAFIYVGDTGEFEYMSEEFEKRTKNLKLGLNPFKSFPKFLESAGYSNNFLAIQITYGGMACGPIWFTDIYGYEFSGETD